MDWGTKQNMEEYGQPTPPPYNLTTVTAPIVLYWGENDWLASPKVKKQKKIKRDFNLNFYSLYTPSACREGKMSRLLMMARPHPYVGQSAV